MTLWKNTKNKTWRMEKTTKTYEKKTDEKEKCPPLECENSWHMENTASFHLGSNAVQLRVFTFDAGRRENTRMEWPLNPFSWIYYKFFIFGCRARNKNYPNTICMYIAILNESVELAGILPMYIYRTAMRTHTPQNEKENTFTFILISNHPCPSIGHFLCQQRYQLYCKQPKHNYTNRIDLRKS